eukprot:tig00000601_g2298.t1
MRDATCLPWSAARPPGGPGHGGGIQAHKAAPNAPRPRPPQPPGGSIAALELAQQPRVYEIFWLQQDMAPHKRKADDVEESEAGPSSACASSDGADGHRASSSASDAVLDEMRKRAECPVCLEMYKDPRSLTACEHTLCSGCAKGHGAIKELPRNLMAAGLLELLHEQLSKAPRPICVNCKEAHVNTICSSCNGQFCNSCSAKIHEIQFFKSHKLQPYRLGISSSTFRSSGYSYGNAGLRYYCQAHPSEPLLYCQKKKAEACLRCISAADHAGHVHVSIDEGAAILQRELSDTVREHKADLAALDILQNQQQQIVQRVEQDSASAIAAANSHAAQLVASIEEKRRSWIVGIEESAKAKAQTAQQQLEAIKAARDQLQQALDHGQELMSNDPLRAVRLQPAAMAAIRAGARRGDGQLQLPQAFQPESLAFRADVLKLTSNGSPVNMGVGAESVKVLLPWRDLPHNHSYVSDTFYCCGLPWELEWYPKGYAMVDESFTSSFVNSGLPELPRGFVLKAELKMDVPGIFKEDEIEVHSWDVDEVRNKVGSGYTQFIERAKILQQAERDGNIVVEVTMKGVKLTCGAADN